MLVERWTLKPLSPRIAQIAAASFRHKAPPEIRGRGYVVDSLEAALWALHHAGSFRRARCQRSTSAAMRIRRGSL